MNETMLIHLFAEHNIQIMQDYIIIKVRNIRHEVKVLSSWA